MTWISAPSDAQVRAGAGAPAMLPEARGPSFAALLDPEPAAPGRDGAHARGFDELGMFGQRYREESNSKPSFGGLTAIDAADAATGEAIVARASDRVSARPDAPADIRATAASEKPSDTSKSVADRPDMIAALSAIAFATTASSGNAPSDDGGSVEAHSPRRSAAGPAGSQTPTSRMTVGGEGRTVNVVARLPGGDAEAELRLRRRIGEIVAEWCFELSALHLNGSRAESGFVIMSGGSHGNRTR